MKNISLKERLIVNVKLKKVYYCSYCKKYSLRKDIMINHEKGCTKNSNRYCKLCELIGQTNNIPELINKYKHYSLKPIISNEEQDEILTYIKQDTGECPNCILTILRLSGLQLYNFDYKEKLKRFWGRVKVI